MKKIALMLVTSTTVALLGLVALAPAGATVPDGTEGNPFGPGDKVTFCHYDGSDNGGGGSGKYNQPDASTTATGPAGHIGHAFDVIPSYFFQQNQNDPVVFYAGVNWPTLTNLPSSPVDFTPLLGSSASTFIAGGCAAPVTTTTTTTTTTVTPPSPTASLSTPVCTNTNIVATGVNPTNAPITFDVLKNGVLVDSFIVAANSTSTSAAIPAANGEVFTVKVQGSQTVLDTETVSLVCTTTPPVVTTPPPVVTTPPPVVTTPPPVVTTPPPPVGGGNPPPGPGGNPNNPPNNPPPANLNPPNKLAFTGPEAALPIGALAVALATAGSGMLWLGRKRRDVTPPRPDLDQ